MTTKHTQSIEITDAETCQLVAELVELTGQNQTNAIRNALRSSIERERVASERLRKLQAISLRSADIARESGIAFPTQQEVDAWLFDENGAPK